MLWNIETQGSNSNKENESKKDKKSQEDNLDLVKILSHMQEG